MSFSFLPLPLFILMMAFCSIYLFYYAKKIWTNDPKFLIIGILFGGACSLLAIPYKIADTLNLINDGSWIKAAMGIPGLAALTFIVIGGYQKVWHDRRKRRMITVVVAFLVLDLLIGGLIVIYLIYFAQR